MSIEKNIEYAAIGFSALGAAVALATQQVVYLATPFTISLAISLSNRQREITRCNTRIANLEQSHSAHSQVTFREIQSIKNMDLGKSDVSSLIFDAGLNSESVVEDSIHIPDIYDRIDDLDSSLITLRDFSMRLDDKFANSIALDKDIDEIIQEKVNKSIQEQFTVIKQILPQKYSYNLISGRYGSREVFIDALKQAEKSLFLICPWITKYAIDSEVERLIEAALQRGVCINIGWGHLKDVEGKRSQLSKENLLSSSRWSYNAVPILYSLKNRYPDLLNIKILGTHEKFLVCDRKFAMIGSHNFMTSGASSSERELGVKTDNVEVINDLIELFNKVEIRGEQLALNLN
jgi:phosphatidylserine/phosphatidylglycerophosphate/cardiolipin synthase-like enzyme